MTIFRLLKENYTANTIIHRRYICTWNIPLGQASIWHIKGRSVSHVVSFQYCDEVSTIAWTQLPSWGLGWSVAQNPIYNDIKEPPADSNVFVDKSSTVVKPENIKLYTLKNAEINF